MENENNPPVGGEENKKQSAMLKTKISNFLIKYFNYFAVFGGMAIFICGLMALPYPEYKKISKENMDLANKMKTEYAEKLERLIVVGNIKKSYASVSMEEKTKVSNMIPDLSDASEAIREIEMIALRNGAMLDAIKIEPKSPSAGAKIKAEAAEDKNPPAGIFLKPPQEVGLVKIEVNLSSVNYPVLKNIIRTFENNLRLFDVARVNFNANNSEAVLHIYGYYLL